MAAFLLAIIRSSRCLLRVCATVSEVGFCCQATTGHSSPSADGFCFYPYEKNLNECSDMSVLALIHAAARLLSLSPAQCRRGGSQAALVPPKPLLLLLMEVRDAVYHMELCATEGLCPQHRGACAHPLPIFLHRGCSGSRNWCLFSFTSMAGDLQVH